MSRKRLILAGIIGRYPIGGVTWCALHYIAGFQALGYEVFYLEDTGECGFDPVRNSITTDPAYALAYIKRHLQIVGLEHSWTYVDYTGQYYGRSRSEVAEWCSGADLFVNLSGGYWPRAQEGETCSERVFHPEYEPIPKIFIDTDPAFTQLALNRAGPGWYRDFFAAHDALFTFALNKGSPSCRLAETPFHWHVTAQPIALSFWPVVPCPQGAPYSAILSWRNDSFLGLSTHKGANLESMIDLPSKLPCPVLLAVAGQCPADLLTHHGWEVTDGVKATIDAATYREFIRASRGELGFAKPLYIETRCGWFSDRTQCYMATGRPALIRDTGVSEVLPCGEGLVVFEDEQGLLDGMRAIECDYSNHSRKARELAEEFFASEKVLAKLLNAASL